MKHKPEIIFFGSMLIITICLMLVPIPPKIPTIKTSTVNQAIDSVEYYQAHGYHIQKIVIEFK